MLLIRKVMLHGKHWVHQNFCEERNLATKRGQRKPVCTTSSSSTTTDTESNVLKADKLAPYR